MDTNYFYALKRSKIIFTIAFFFCGWNAMAQETFPRNDVKDVRPGLFAFTNATIVVDYQTTMQNATLLVKNGKVEQVASNLAPPKPPPPRVRSTSGRP